jgi:uncharacterized damage-inducible protein DinB
VSHAPLLDHISRDLHLTRRLLERLPESALAWRPHIRSFTVAGLGTHLAQVPHWGVQILRSDGYDLASATGHRHEAASRTGLLAAFDRSVAEWQHAADTTPPEVFGSVWSLRRGATVLETMSRAEAVERYLLHHLIHHRGQLTVYLRMLGVPLPPLYGPTADEHP